MSFIVKHIFYAVSLLTTLFSSFVCRAQMEKLIVRGGNEQYNSGKYEEAAQSYKAATKKSPSYNKAYYNLGAAQYKTAMNLKKNANFRAKYGAKSDSIIKQVFDEAGTNFDVFANGKTYSKDSAQCAMHNLGNACLMGKEYQKAVDAYKKALKYNPKDEDTRYNLAYAQKKLKEQQDKEDKNKDKDKENKDKKEDEKKDEKKDIKNKKDQQEQKAPDQMSKEEAQRMLDALKNAEKKMHQIKKVKGEKKEVEKDW